MDFPRGEITLALNLSQTLTEITLETHCQYPRRALSMVKKIILAATAAIALAVLPVVAQAEPASPACDTSWCRATQNPASNSAVTPGPTSSTGDTSW